MKKSWMFFALLLMLYQGKADTGYKLWLRYDPVTDVRVRNSYLNILKSYVVSGNGTTADIIRKELQLALPSLLGQPVPYAQANNTASVIFAIASDPTLKTSKTIQQLVGGVGPEGFVIAADGINKRIIVTANSEIGVLYGMFDFLRLLQTNQPIE